MSTLGEHIKKLRNKKDMTQEDLATALQIKRATLSNWEIDRALPDAYMLKKIADYFGVSTDLLLGRTDYRSGLCNETIASYCTDDSLSDLPPEARKSVEDFIQFVRKQYGTKE